MNKLFTLFFLLTPFASKSQTPDFEWAKQIDGDVFVSSLAANVDGSLITTGVFTGTVDFDPGSGVHSETDHGFGDMFICKTDAAGNLAWARAIGSFSYDEGKSVAVDAAGNIYVAGFFNGDSVDFDPGPGSFTMNAFENSFVLKLNAAGEFVWARQLAGVSENYAVSLALDQQGNILVTGLFNGTADFDPGAGTHDLVASGSDIYIWKLGNQGDLVWAKQISSLSSGTRSYSITTDHNENVIVSGMLIGTTDLDPGTPVFNLTNSLASPGTFILKLNATGDFGWAKKLEGINNFLYNGDILVDNDDNLYTAGNFTGTADFDPDGGAQNLTASAGNDNFLLKLDENGAFIRVKPLPEVKAIASDGSNIYACGNSISKWDASGVLSWTIDSSLSFRIAVNAAGDIYTQGEFSGTVDFDPGASVFDLTAGSTSMFVQKLRQQPLSALHPILEANPFVIYPNPASEVFFLQSKTKGNYKLLNGLGQAVKSIQLIDDQPVKVEANGLPAGVYFLISDLQDTHAQLTILH